MTRHGGEMGGAGELAADAAERLRLEAARAEAALESRMQEEAAHERLAEAQATLRDVTPEEREALDRQYAALDAAVVERIDARFGEVLDPERRRLVDETPMVFERHNEYQTGLAEAYSWEESELQPAWILGDVRPDGEPHVDAETIDLPTTSAHEHLHQLSASEFADNFGRSLDEGATEVLAREVAGPIPLADALDVYPGERRIADMVAARVGPDLERAYLTGEMAPLAEALDAQLGEGATARLAELTHAERLEEAEALLKGTNG